MAEKMTFQQQAFPLIIRLFVVVAIFLSTSSRAEVATYNIGVVPQFEARELASIWTPILAELSKRTGLQLKLKGSPRIPEFEVGFEAGEFDFAYMNPYHALVAMRKQGYVPLVRDEAPLYGVLVVKKDSTITAVKELAGKKISFPAPNALGASLLMRADLDSLFHVKVTGLYAQTHTSAYLNTVLGVSDASGGVIKTFEKLKPDIRESLRILYETRKLPSHPLVAHPRVPVTHQNLIQKALLDMAATPEGAALLAKIPMEKPIPATQKEYAELNALKLDKYFVKSGE